MSDNHTEMRKELFDGVQKPDSKTKKILPERGSLPINQPPYVGKIDPITGQTPLSEMRKELFDGIPIYEELSYEELYKRVNEAMELLSIGDPESATNQPNDVNNFEEEDLL